MSTPYLDIDASLDRLCRWEDRAVQALAAHRAKTADGEDASSELAKDVEDFAIAAYREIGDVVLKCQEQLELTWRSVGASRNKSSERAKEFVEFVLKPHPALRAALSARHADAHLGGLVVPRVVFQTSAPDGSHRDELEVWMSPKIPDNIHDLLRPASQLSEEELVLFNAPDNLPYTLRDLVMQVERFVGEVYGETDRIQDEEAA